MHVDGRGSLTRYSFDARCSDDGSAKVTIDLERLTFIEPYAVVALACLIAQADVEWWQVTVIPPANTSVANYLSRTSLGRVLIETGYAWPLAEVFHSTGAQTVLELQKVLPGTGCDDLADMVVGWVGESFEGGAVGELEWGLLELGYNVEEHSRTTGFFAAQVFPATKTIEFAFGDWGIGIRQSLAEAGHHYSDDAAITAAVESRLSSKSSDGGFGLPQTMKAVVRLGGDFVVRSGAVRARWAPGTSGTASVPGLLSGTIVAARMRCA